MFRFISRVLGLVLLALGFVGLVIDGTRSIANNAVTFRSIGEVAALVFKDRYLQLQPAIERNLHPVLWDPVVRETMLAPASIAAFVLGLLLLWLGQRPKDPIGFAFRR